MTCNVIDECRCYQLRGNSSQFCGVRRGPGVLRCPEECCFGGCVSDGSRPPFRYIDISDRINKEPLIKLEKKKAIDKLLVIFIVTCIVFLISLKIKR